MNNLVGVISVDGGGGIIIIIFNVYIIDLVVTNLANQVNVGRFPDKFL